MPVRDHLTADMNGQRKPQLVKQSPNFRVVERFRTVFRQLHLDLPHALSLGNLHGEQMLALHVADPHRDLL